MAKGSAKPSAINLPPLKQARLVGINNHVKSVRQKPVALYSNSTPIGLKQSGLSAFGFSAGGDRTNVIERPSPKRRKKLAVDFEIPETQFALNTQSPAPSSFNHLTTNGGGKEGYSSRLSSLPPEVSSLSPISSFITIPPPTIPMTPKRRRVTEVPDSKSPPVTPFTPYASQKRDNWLDPEPSPTAHKRISPIVQSTEECSGSYSSTPTPTQSLRQRDKDDKIMAQKGNEKVEGMGEVAEAVGAMSGDGDTIINSSQWWENDDTQNFLPSTQVIQQHKNKCSQGYIGHSTALPESGIRHIQDENLFHLRLSHKRDPLAENADERCGAYGPQADRATSQGGINILESFRGDARDLQPILDYDRVLKNKNPPSPTTIQEDPETVENCNESQEYPVYGAYRTQEFPSSFYQHNNYRFSSPGIPPSSRIVNESYSAGKVDNRGQKRSRSLSGVTETGPDAGDEWNDSHDKESSSQLLSRLFNRPAATRDDPQFLPVLMNELNTMVGSRVDGGDYKNEQDIQNSSIKDENDGEGRGKIGRHHEIVTRSQLLPSELMETFPMPPPLSQFSSYGPYCCEYGEREIQ